MKSRSTLERPVLSRRALNRALLARQLLLDRSTMSPLAAVERLAGLQAQAPLPPYYALWTRLAGFQPDALAQLLLDRRVVRIALMRSTIHLVSARDCLALRPLIQPVLDRGLRGAHHRDLAGLDEAAVADAARAYTEAAPHTAAELGALLGERWPGVGADTLAAVARTRLALVQVPPRGVWGASGP
ncbi:DNA glycosylase AlkZ-like family protein, partial [Paenibacillus koleovorans]|uniref:DNA glycosylase AlkZ-like family protein n=1 Tax=Paenibacillus koleovorans TaxID=121608 RepID=UPI0013E2E59E